MNQLEALKILRLIVPFLLFLPGCQRQEPPVTPAEPVQELVEHTLYASTPGEDAHETRTIISPYNDEKILWSAHERISILPLGGGNYPFQGNNDNIESSASFTGMGPANLGNYIALYPYDASASYDGTYVSTTLPAVQTGRIDTFADGCLITADDASGRSISFNHLCSGIRFVVRTNNIKAVSIRGNNGEKIAGDFRFSFASADTPEVGAGTEESVTLKAPGVCFESWAYYYIVTLPTTFTKGLTLIADNGTQIGELRFDSEVKLSPGVFKNVTGQLDDRITTWKPAMAYYGPENSFCLRPGGSVSFDVTPRLIEDSWQRGPVSLIADVPDGTEVLWGNSTASLSGTTLTLTAAATEGSSLVAIKKGETILWSYLIWVTAEAPSGNVLPPLGGQLYFQWGRKDPLSASSTGVDNKGSNGLSYSISHPCDFIAAGGSGYDWFTDSLDQDDSLWGEGGSKTVWDPCPSGYRVPSSTDSVPGSADSYGYITNFGNTLSVYSGTSLYWSRDAYKGDMLHQCYFSPGSSGRQYRYIAYPVRCIKE